MNTSNNVLNYDFLLGPTGIPTNSDITLNTGFYDEPDLTNFNSNETLLGITTSYDSHKNSISYFSPDGSDFTFNVNENQTKLLGLPQGANTSISGILTTDSINLNGFDEVRIHTDIPIFSTNTKNNRKDILCSVYPNASYLEMIQYTNESFFKIKLNTRKLGAQSFSLRNEFGELLNLNGQEWSMTDDFNLRHRKSRIIYFIKNDYHYIKILNYYIMV